MSDISFDSMTNINLESTMEIPIKVVHDHVPAISKSSGSESITLDDTFDVTLTDALGDISDKSSKSSKSKSITESLENSLDSPETSPKMSYSDIGKNMSYSIYVDKKPHMYEHKRRIKKWVPDESVKKCNKCNTEFTFYTRKHHCRVCGKIYCYSCSKHRIKIPKDMLCDMPENPNQYSTTDITEHRVKVCIQCKDNVDNFKKFYGIVKERKIEFDMFKLKGMCQSNLAVIEEIEDSQGSSEYGDTDALVSQYISERDSSIQAAIYCLGKLREIQYKLPTDELTKLEKDLLWANRQYFCGHSKWLVQMLKIIDYKSPKQVGELDEILSKSRKHSCFDAMCTRHCTPKIELIDLIDLLHIKLQNPLINRTIEHSVSNADREEIFLFLPFISFYIHNNDCLLEVLMKKFVDDDAFMAEFYWCVVMYNVDRDYVDAFDDIMKELPIYDKILSMKKLQKYDKKKDYSNIITPVDPGETFIDIDRKKVKVIPSASKPMIIPFIRKAGSRKRIMLKNEDVRKDHIVSNLINLAYIQLKKDKIIDVDMVKYKICPLTVRSGLIEIVEDAETIFNITENLKFTVQNYIAEHNPERSVHEISDRFMQSAAIYCILTYLLGVGDRHLDNVMVTTDGLLFHIDFGYVVGKDPKYSSNHIKIAPEIVNVIGGYNSKYYKIFKEYCVKIYNKLRLHINAFMNMLLIVSYIDKSITRDNVRELLLTRFEVGESSLDAAIHMDTKINVGGYTFVDKVIDVLYKSKQSTFVKSISYLKDMKKHVKNHIKSML